MSLDRATLRGSAAKITFNSGTFFTKDDIITRFKADWKDVVSSVHGTVDQFSADRTITVPFTLWGAYENLPTLFPAWLLNPNIGSWVYGTADLPLVVHGKNNDRLTIHNAQLTKMTDLFLGVNGTIFAQGEFTGLIRNTFDPETANAYYTLDTAAYTDATFARTNFKQQRYGSAWGAVAGFTSFQAKDGWNIAWQAKLDPFQIDALGTVDFKVLDFMAQAKCIPVEPTNAQMIAFNNFQGTALGGLLSAGANNLVITGAGVSVTLNKASIIESGLVWSPRLLRNGETVWKTTAGFTAGVADPKAVVA
jgi:hypothetical protein